MKIAQATEQTHLTVVIVSYNTVKLTLQCLSRLRSSVKTSKLKIIVVDNASSDGSPEIISNEIGNAKDVTLIRNAQNLGFGRANNIALAHITTELILLLNSDVLLNGGEVDGAAAIMRSRPDVGVLGVRLVDQEQKEQPSARSFPTPASIFKMRTGYRLGEDVSDPIDSPKLVQDEATTCDWVPGCFYFTRRSLADKIGLFDPRFFLYYEEVDHCRRVHTAGFKVACFNRITVTHLGGESAKTVGKITGNGKQLSKLQTESELLYFRKHYGVKSVILHLALVGLADMNSVVRTIVKRMIGRSTCPVDLRLIGYWRSLTETQFATRPTR